MIEPVIIREFPKCYHCGHEDVCAMIGCEGILDIPEGQIVSLSQEIIFLKNPQLAAVTVPALVYHYDVCASCGTRRCVRVERRELPVQHRPVPGMPPMFGQGKNPPFGGGRG